MIWVQYGPLKQLVEHWASIRNDGEMITLEYDALRQDVRSYVNINVKLPDGRVVEGMIEGIFQVLESDESEFCFSVKLKDLSKELCTLEPERGGFVRLDLTRKDFLPTANSKNPVDSLKIGVYRQIKRVNPEHTIRHYDAYAPDSDVHIDRRGGYIMFKEGNAAFHFREEDGQGNGDFLASVRKVINPKYVKQSPDYMKEDLKLMPKRVNPAERAEEDKKETAAPKEEPKAQETEIEETEDEVSAAIAAAGEDEFIPDTSALQEGDDDDDDNAWMLGTATGDPDAVEEAIIMLPGDVPLDQEPATVVDPSEEYDNTTGPDTTGEDVDIVPMPEDWEDKPEEVEEDEAEKEDDQTKEDPAEALLQEQEQSDTEEPITMKEAVIAECDQEVLDTLASVIEEEAYTIESVLEKAKEAAQSGFKGKSRKKTRESVIGDLIQEGYVVLSPEDQEALVVMEEPDEIEEGHVSSSTNPVEFIKAAAIGIQEAVMQIEDMLAEPRKTDSHTIDEAIALLKSLKGEN